MTNIISDELNYYFTFFTDGTGSDEVIKNLKLIDACSTNSIELVKHVLQNNKGINIYERDENGYTSLMIASINNSEKILKLLLSTFYNVIDVNGCDNIGDTAFALAIRFDSIESINVLSNFKRTKINKTNMNDETPFMVACKYGSFPVITMLIKNHKIDPNVSDKFGNTPLMVLVGRNYLFGFNSLVFRPDVFINKKNKRGETALLIATREDYTEFALSLIKCNEIDINESDRYGHTPIMHAITNNNIKLIFAFLQKQTIYLGRCTIKERETALMIAINVGNKDVIEQLLKFQHLNINKLNSNSLSVLMIAVQFEMIDIIPLILQHRETNINKSDMFGNTALTHAIQTKNIYVIELLLFSDDIYISEEEMNEIEMIYNLIQRPSQPVEDRFKNIYI